MSLHSNKKFAQRFVRTLARKAGEGWEEGTGMASFIIEDASDSHAR